ncbi:MAG: hypothetical protein ABIJ34_01945 [archaeon]
MRKKLKKMFLLGAKVAKKGLNLAHKKNIKSVVREFVKDGKLAAKEGSLLVRELYHESVKFKNKVKARVRKTK